jgi:hypothetical protein
MDCKSPLVFRTLAGATKKIMNLIFVILSTVKTVMKLYENGFQFWSGEHIYIMPIS